MKWTNVSDIQEKDYSCGYCGKDVGPSKGFVESSGATNKCFIYICPRCSKPTFIDGQKNQTPKPLYGNNVDGISDNNIKSLYHEARECVSVGAYTAAVMVCRKILMNLAVQHKADENKTFAHYVDYLVTNGFVPPQGKTWVDAIRLKANEATHEIPIIGIKDAYLILDFTEQLLRNNYELPYKLETHNNP